MATLADPNPCCVAGTIQEYDALPGVDVAKARGNVALYCSTCHARLVFVESAWRKEET